MYPGMNYGSGLFGGMPQYGGMPQFGGYMPQMYGGGFGGYNPYQQMMMNPYGYGMYGGGMFAPGFLDQFQGQLNDMFSKYFGQQPVYGDMVYRGVPTQVQPSNPQTPAQPSPEQPAAPETTTQRAGPSTVGPSSRAGMSGDYYLRTGELSKGAQDKAINTYGSLDNFWASTEGQNLQNQYQASNRDKGSVSKGRTPGSVTK